MVAASQQKIYVLCAVSRHGNIVLVVNTVVIENNIMLSCTSVHMSSEYENTGANAPVN